MMELLLNKFMYKCIVLLIVSLLAPQLVLAVGIGVQPTSLNLSANAQGEASGKITISNPSAEPGLFTVSADDLSSQFSINPTEVRLEAQESRVINIIFYSKQAGRWATNLSVVGYPLDTRSFNAGSGLKVPINLTVDQVSGSVWWIYIIIGAGLVLLISFFAFKHWRKRSVWYRLSHPLLRKIRQPFSF